MSKFACLMVLVPLLVLSACKEEAKLSDDDGRNAQGEVLQGSISDAMIPLDELRSQPPLQDDEDDDGGTPGANAAPSAELAPDQTAEPAAEPEEPATE